MTDRRTRPDRNGKRTAASGSPEATVALASLRLNDRNPRTIKADAFARLCESIKRDPEFMALRPIVVDAAGVILGGNQRYRACVALGMTEVPATWVRVAADLTADQRRRFIVLDNAPDGIAGEWDEDLLAACYDLAELKDLGFDKLLAEIEAAGAGETGADADPQIDRAEELRKRWGVERGQVWTLGDHRLMCGDSTSAEDVGRLLAGAVPFLCVTDPPYGVEYDADWRDEAAKHCPSMGNRKDTAKGKVTNDDRADWSAAWRLFPGDVLYSWHPAGATSLVHAAAIQTAGFTLRMQIIWAKNQFPIGRGDYHVKHEPCWYAVRDGKAARFTDDRTQTTLWEIDKPHKSETGHSTQKPVECMARPIRNHPTAAEVYEPFCGSGTTIIACEQLHRRCYAMEISPGYVAVALQRWADATGKKPCLT
jgi:DNA modification methylase